MSKDQEPVKTEFSLWCLVGRHDWETVRRQQSKIEPYHKVEIVNVEIPKILKEQVCLKCGIRHDEIEAEEIKIAAAQEREERRKGRAEQLASMEEKPDNTGAILGSTILWLMLLLAVFKLITNQISWLWVLSPLWISMAFSAMFWLFYCISLGGQIIYKEQMDKLK